jgi:transposase-like protein
MALGGRALIFILVSLEVRPQPEKKDSEFMVDLKRVYKTSRKELAEVELNSLDSKWAEKYPIVIRLWRNSWGKIESVFQVPRKNTADYLHYKLH